ERGAPGSLQFAGPDGGELSGDRVDGDRFRLLAQKSQQDGRIGAVPFSCGGERAVEVAAQARHAGGDASVRQPPDETAGGAHRAHGVGGGGADSYGEKVKSGKSHGAGRSLSGGAAGRKIGARIDRSGASRC